MKWDNMKKYSPLGLSIISSLFTILGLIVHGKWDTDTERYIDELALLIFQMFPILYYRDINGTKGKPAVLGGIVFHLAFGISLFLMSLGVEREPTHFVICAISAGLFLIGVFQDKVKFY